MSWKYYKNITKEIETKTEIKKTEIKLPLK